MIDRGVNSKAGARRTTVCLLMPVLNEAEALREILVQIDPTWVDEILIVDGGSTDGTVEIAREWGHAKVMVQQQRGLSNAYWEAFPHIASEAILTFSPDGNSLASSIPELVARLEEGYDMVVGSRYLPDSGSDDDDWLTAFGNRMFTHGINVLFNARYTDTLVMLRIYRKSLIAELPMDTRLPAFEPQLGIRCAMRRRRVGEIPAFEPARIGGVRKMSVVKNGLSILGIVAREYLSYRLLRWEHGKAIPTVEGLSAAEAPPPYIHPGSRFGVRRAAKRVLEKMSAAV